MNVIFSIMSAMGSLVDCAPIKQLCTKGGHPYLSDCIIWFVHGGRFGKANCGEDLFDLGEFLTSP